MLLVLYKEVFGEEAIATEETLDSLTQALTGLPDNIFNALYQYYIHSKTSDVIAAEAGHSRALIEHWLKTGVSLLQSLYGVQG
jgi:DNA-directed RNA polymerase specialized sigma24 family protein